MARENIFRNIIHWKTLNPTKVNAMGPTNEKARSILSRTNSIQEVSI